MNAIFTLYLLPECYHYEPFADYTKDNFQKLRCLWMMFGYFVLKRWETVKKYLDFRKKKSDSYKWKPETPEENAWREFMKEAEEREYKIDVGYNTFQ
jgi:hypothetical protein